MITIKQHQIFEAEIVRQCAPTLAGIKIANLFTYTFSCNEECFNAISSVRKILSDKSIYIELLKYNIISHRALLLVYRKNSLQKTLCNYETQDFLREQGFESPASYQEVIEELVWRLNNSSVFPHEIGLLLGYPLEDVKAYMATPHSPGLCSGCWKAYSNLEQAKYYFEKCHHCVNSYVENYLRGMPLEQLTVAV
ncbi:MAG: DUF3793 family protein [Acidaminococcaceae bacterium]|jgi:hypothetical protein|nr:DUF3793 family protein [Acidaminococcaceae bacterium]